MLRYYRRRIDIFPEHYTVLLSVRIYVFFFCVKKIYSFSSKAVDEFIVMKTVQQSKSRRCAQCFSLFMRQIHVCPENFF